MMNFSLRKTLLFPLILLALLISGCSSIKIVDLKPQSIISNDLKNESNVTVSIDAIEVIASRYKDTGKWQEGLTDALHGEGMFKTIYSSSQDKNTDLLIRGEMSGNFRSHGARNFFTWWPGALVFAQGWRGTRYIYDASSDIEIVNAKSGEILGKYHTESSYKIVHKSYNPWHLFGTLFVFPGIIKASSSVSPNAYYRNRIYNATYPNLWRKMAVLIHQGQSKTYSQRIVALKNKCGTRLNQKIKIGMIWSKFVSCQTSKFSFLGQESIESGLTSIYVSADKSLRIHVANNGRVIRWYQEEHH